jgi:hypothetical protein
MSKQMQPIAQNPALLPVPSTRPHLVSGQAGSTVEVSVKATTAAMKRIAWPESGEAVATVTIPTCRTEHLFHFLDPYYARRGYCDYVYDGV